MCYAGSCTCTTFTMADNAWAWCRVDIRARPRRPAFLCCSNVMMASVSNVLNTAISLSETDILGAALLGWKPEELKNQELRFWLKCRGDPAKGLKTKAELVKRVNEYNASGKDKEVVDPDPQYTAKGSNIVLLLEAQLRRQPHNECPWNFQATDMERPWKGCRCSVPPRWIGTLKVLANVSPIKPTIHFQLASEKPSDSWTTSILKPSSAQVIKGTFMRSRNAVTVSGRMSRHITWKLRFAWYLARWKPHSAPVWLVHRATAITF